MHHPFGIHLDFEYIFEDSIYLNSKYYRFLELTDHLVLIF
jgi:hypothetical protein